MINCKVCECQINELSFNLLFDDRYGYPGLFKLFKCKNCGHRELEGKFTAEMLLTLYSEYYPRSAARLEDYKPYKKVSGFYGWLDGIYSMSFRWVPENVIVLDIGCGFGETLGYHSERGCVVYGVEADKNIQRVAEKFGFNVHVGLFDPNIYKPDFFDYVTMDQVIEHVTDPVITLRGIYKVLKPGGYAVLSLPNPSGWGARLFGKRWVSWHVPYHLQHFSIASMSIAAEKAGFTIEKYKTITNALWLYYQWMHCITFPEEGKPSAFWSSKTKLSSYHFVFMRINNLMHKSKINHLITRVFDALKLGDNYIFILRKPK